MSYTLSNGTTPATAVAVAANGSSNGAKSHLVYGLSSPIESASSALDDHHNYHLHHHFHQQGHHGAGASTSASMHDPQSENGCMR